MNKKKVLIAWMLVFVVVMLSGCKPVEPAKEAGNSPVSTATIKDSAGREIRIPASIKRVIVLNTSTFTMLQVLGSADTVIGVNSSTKKTEAAAAKLEDFGSYMESNIEKIVAARPDMVIANSNMKPAQLKQLEEAGITVAFFEFYLPSILHDEIITLGKLFKKEEQAQKYDEFITKYRKILETRLKDIKPENKVTAYFENTGEYFTVAHGAGGDELITEAGGMNVAGQENVKYPKVSAEWVLQKNPQVIVKVMASDYHTMGECCTDQAAVKAVYDNLISRVGWNELSAVKNNKVLLLAHKIGATPEGSIIGTLYMAKMMYPDRFMDIDPYKVYQQMEKEFFSVDTKGIIIYP